MQQPIHQRLAKTTTCALALTLSAAAGLAQTPTVHPTDRETLEGETSTNYPLGRFNSRFQQIFDDLGPSRLLAGQAYRRDSLSTRGTIQPFKTQMSIQLSTTTVKAAAASSHHRRYPARLSRIIAAPPKSTHLSGLL